MVLILSIFVIFSFSIDLLTPSLSLTSPFLRLFSFLPSLFLSFSLWCTIVGVFLFPIFRFDFILLLKLFSKKVMIRPRMTLSFSSYLFLSSSLLSFLFFLHLSILLFLFVFDVGGGIFSISFWNYYFSIFSKKLCFLKECC